ncbi:MAG: TIM barrel protein, partial [Armatimonadetes bacterium]|nr:TIM barrel protein [Armatimonadota bacterium]
MPLQDIRPQATQRSPQELIDHLNHFNLDLKFTVGVWYFAPVGSRFAARYSAEMTMEERLDLSVELMEYGLVGVEAHYPNEVNEDNIDLFRKYEDQHGLRLVTIIPNLFYDEQFEFGSLSNPIEKVRREAIDRTKRTLELNKEYGTDFSVVWPGGDGYENPFGVDYYAMWERFEDGLAESMDAVPGVRIAIEPKPYEPRGSNIWRHTPNGILMGRNVEAKLQNDENRRLLSEGHNLVCLNPEVGHVLMGYEDLAYAYASVMREARLAHVHWNSQPLGNYDQDLNVGVLSPEQNEALLYTLKMYGYTGYHGIDINPLRMPIRQALINNFDAIRSMNDRINSLDHARILDCDRNPDETRG